jgi:carboxymethylenebutenolidase
MSEGGLGMGSFVNLEANDGHELGSYVTRPEGTTLGAIVVIQEIFGVNAHIRSVADSYAKEGYVAIAPALFDRYERGIELNYGGEDGKKAFELYAKLSPATALLDVDAAFRFVQTDGHKGIGIVGFCYGGLMSWLSATRGETVEMRPACCVGYYPGGIGNVATEEPSCPVMLHFGGADSHIGSEQREAVAKAHPEVEIFVYEGAEHGFNRDVWSSYDPEAAKLARQRTSAFFKAHIA